MAETTKKSKVPRFALTSNQKQILKSLKQLAKAKEYLSRRVMIDKEQLVQDTEDLKGISSMMLQVSQEKAVQGEKMFAQPEVELPEEETSELWRNQ